MPKSRFIPFSDRFAFRRASLLTGTIFPPAQSQKKPDDGQPIGLMLAKVCQWQDRFFERRLENSLPIAVPTAVSSAR